MITASEMRTRLGLAETDDHADTLIGTLLTEAEAYVRSFCRLRDTESVPDGLIARMVAEDYGRLDGAGLTSRAVSGATEHYLTDYSAAVRRQLTALRHAGSVRHTGSVRHAGSAKEAVV